MTARVNAPRPFADGIDEVLRLRNARIRMGDTPILLIALYGSTKDLLEAANHYLGGILAGRLNARVALLQVEILKGPKA